MTLEYDGEMRNGAKTMLEPQWLGQLGSVVDETELDMVCTDGWELMCKVAAKEARLSDKIVEGLSGIADGRAGTSECSVCYNILRLYSMLGY